MSNIFHRQNAANLITVSRLGFLPFIILAGIRKQPGLFVGLFAAQSFFDGIDGLVARRLHIESDLGRRLDTIIDLAIWLPSIALFGWLAWDEFRAIFPEYLPVFLIPTLTSILMYLTAYHYLHRTAAIHLYSGKLTSALVLILMLTMLFDHFHPILGYLTACAGVVYHLEAMAIYIIQKDRTDENITSLIWCYRGKSP